jgi:hypothetical protein
LILGHSGGDLGMCMTVNVSYVSTIEAEELKLGELREDIAVITPTQPN